ncbi:MAG: hypothetical protein A3E87_07470 [Gammaproteobacteria bacterium RIFCSPHIGHO2_12_FULL_35_23]|nr:MAG: hypothetical protein A3E87_07470 [Gammaproteobacteria bacterium RIFCSPHIGHO2_12_FULL_35_23]
MFFIVILLAIMGLIGTDIFTPSLPAIAEAFHQSPNATQLTISLFLCGFAFSQLFYGPFSDRIGRKLPLILGVSIFTLGSIICATTPSFLYLCLGRLIEGLGVGSGLSLARVIIRDRYQGTLMAVRSSQIATFVSLTPAVAPFFGGLLQQHFGFRASFIFMTAYGFLLLVLMLFYFKETIQYKDKNLTLHHTLINYSRLIKNTQFMRYVLISGLAFSSIILCANIMPFIIQNQLKFSAIQNGEIILIAALGVSCGALLSSQLVKTINPEKLINYGLTILVICGALLIWSQYCFGTTLYCLIPLIFLITISCGFIFPNALTLSFAQVTVNIGIAGAIYGFIQILISTLTNFLLNFITAQGQSLLGIFYLSIGIIGLLLFYYPSHLLFKSRKIFISE